MGRHPRLALVLVAASLALVTRAVPAQPWDQRYNLGLELEAQRKWGHAIAEFQAAAAEKPRPARRAPTPAGGVVLGYDPHYHLALCLVELGRPGLAAQALKKSAAAHVTPPEKLLALRDRIQALSMRQTPPFAPNPTVGELLVETEPPGAEVSVDGAPRGPAPLAPLSLPPGVYLVRAALPGYDPVEREVTVVPGGTSTLLISLVAVRSPATTPTPAATRGLQPMGSTPSPALTQVQAVLAPTEGPPTPAPAPPAEAAARRRPAAALGALALLVILTFAVVHLLRRRRHLPRPAVATAPTRVLDHGATLAERGTTFGEYEVQGVLGRGGMATTFRARRMRDARPAAVKVPHDVCLADPTFVARFLREGALGQQLHHPGIVRVLETGEERGRPYLAMELIAGRTLKEELRTSGPLPLRRALEIARDIAEALDYAHAKGVIHRDLKPENVMILPDTSVKVMDFGIARVAAKDGLTTSNIFLGTPLYAAPEMVDPKRADHRADLYSLGIILYEMLEGAAPFVADSPYRVLEMHQHAPLPAPETLVRRVPEPVWAMMTKLCEKDPGRRYHDAEALLVELNHLLHDFSALEGGDVF